MMSLIRYTLALVFSLGLLAGYWLGSYIHKDIHIQFQAAPRPGAQAPTMLNKPYFQRTEALVGPLSESPRNVESPL
jgi:hypothetical protein